MDKSLFRAEIVPFLLLFGLLVVAALIGDLLLHVYDLVWVGRYLGIPGTLLVILSLLYSLRKRKIITTGSPRFMLALHEVLAWLGAVMILVHSGVHLNVILPWLALAAMLVNVASGMIGRYLLNRAKRRLIRSREKHLADGKSEAEAERKIFWDAITYEMMVKWRAVHFPIAYAFAALSLGHIFSIFLFWEWM